jgi:ParB-like chromosome segregation protein Spo0J
MTSTKLLPTKSKVKPGIKSAASISSTEETLPKKDTLIVNLMMIKADLIHPHPLNPRPWSDIYQCHVHDDKVEELIASIQASDFDLLEPVQVRQMGSVYQIVAGHHRYCALVALNRKEIPCVLIVVADDVEAAIRLVTRQGRSIDPWDLAKHAYDLCCEEEMCSQTDYSKKTGYQATVVSKWVRAERVRQTLDMRGLSVTACATIARAPENRWRDIANQAIDRKLGTREIDALVVEAQGKTPDIPISQPEVSPSTVTGLEKSVDLDQHLIVRKSALANITEQEELDSSEARSNLSRVNVISLTLLRYLNEKQCAIGFGQLHLEWSFCNASDWWDVSDSSLKQLLGTMIRNDLLAKSEGDFESLYAITDNGCQLVTDFLAIDQNILQRRWQK